jgi:hypothetical protein
LSPDNLKKQIDGWVKETFAWCENIKFNDVFTPEQIVGIIERNVIELKVSGGITELAGQMSRAVFASKSSATTLVEEICPPAMYQEFADKIMSLDAVRGELIACIIRSPAIATLAGRVVSRMLVETNFMNRGSAGGGLHGLVSELQHRLLPEVEQRLERWVEKFVEKRAQQYLRDREQQLCEALDRELLRDVVDEVWDLLSVKPLNEAVGSFSAQDLEDFVVLVFEYWLKFRRTRYFRAVSREVVERLFAKYGDEALATLIADMGVNEAIVSRELLAAFGPLVHRAACTGFLEQQIRAHLEPFYRSAAVLALLDR